MCEKLSRQTRLDGAQKLVADLFACVVILAITRHPNQEKHECQT